MAKLAEPLEPSSEEGLLLTIRNEQAIPIADLAQLLSDLAKDYRKISNGGELIVAKISQGSLIALLHDASGTLGEVNSLIAFGKTLAALVKIALGASANASKLLRGRKPGTQTIKSLAKMAFASGGEVEMKYRKSVFGNEEFFLKINSNEARQIRDIASVGAPFNAALPMQQVPLSPSHREMTEALVRLAERKDGQAVSDLRALIDAIVGALAVRDTHYVFDIIAELEGQGQYAIAPLIREALDRLSANRNSNPQLRG